MPVVTNKFFDAIPRLGIYRAVFLFGIGVLAASPLSLLLNYVPLPLKLLWAVGVLAIIVGLLGWRHWYKVMKANVFSDRPASEASKGVGRERSSGI